MERMRNLNIMITVFTPTYNRAHLLPRLYESLCRQTFTDFEWVIVDDGSVDNTKGIVNKFLVDSVEFLGIRYFYQENGGRIGWLFMIGVICTMSNICIVLKNKRMLMNGALMMVVAFLLFFRILFDWGILLSPYKTFLTNGFREGDPIHERFEYDPSYDVDKFYR